MINFDSLFQPRQKWRRRTHPLQSYTSHRLLREKRKIAEGLFSSRTTTDLADSLTMKVSRDVLTQDIYNPLKEGLLKRSPLSFLTSFRLF